jgi:hypothetical protein
MTHAPFLAQLSMVAIVGQMAYIDANSAGSMMFHAVQSSTLSLPFTYQALYTYLPAARAPLFT